MLKKCYFYSINKLIYKEKVIKNNRIYFDTFYKIVIYYDNRQQILATICDLAMKNIEERKN